MCVSLSVYVCVYLYLWECEFVCVCVCVHISTHLVLLQQLALHNCIAIIVYYHLQEYFNTVMSYLRLEKMDFGGIHGQHLSDLVVAMYNEFTELTNAFQSGGDDPLDIASDVSTSWNVHVKELKEKVELKWFCGACGSIANNMVGIKFGSLVFKFCIANVPSCVIIKW